jgi:hypothetical protein
MPKKKEKNDFDFNEILKKAETYRTVDATTSASEELPSVLDDIYRLLTEAGYDYLIVIREPSPDDGSCFTAFSTETSDKCKEDCYESIASMKRHLYLNFLQMTREWDDKSEYREIFEYLYAADNFLRQESFTDAMAMYKCAIKEIKKIAG